MGHFNCHVALATVLLAGGCAVTPDEPVESVAATVRDEAAESEAPAPNVILDIRDFAPSESDVICREMLRQGSNVIVTRCMTIANWKAFKRYQARDAQEIVRALQRSPYR